MREFCNNDYMRLLQQLDIHHAVFYQLWQAGKPRFSEAIPTAAVTVNQKGEFLEFLINPEYWDSLTEHQKQFVICHECLHLLLKHGTRFFAKDNIDSRIANYATDISINHTIIRRMGFDRSEIDPNNEYCWVDTVFPEGAVIEDNLSADRYYYELIKLAQSGSGEESESFSSSAKTVDDHSGFGKSMDNALDEVMKEVASSLGDDELQAVQEVMKQLSDEFAKYPKNGTASGNAFFRANTTEPVIAKKKWETVIKEWAMKHLKRVDREESQWARMNRRFVMLPDDMFIPTDMEVEDTEKVEDRIPVWFFQDTSGSCYSYAQRFFDAARSLPTEKFDVRLFCFDTGVYETSIKTGKLYGFGGTSFGILEGYIQMVIREEKLEYPRAVFVITDGYGDSVYPQKPENWYWFLTPGNSTYYIPKESSVFKLSDFE